MERRERKDLRRGKTLIYLFDVGCDCIVLYLIR